ncbi:hypothetical protein C2E23DRAFT_237325 [Lenzites betulinus]|nr:hypothetical protein C2E23DRAFT_237325 [Lenzites betulinus]
MTLSLPMGVLRRRVLSDRGSTHPRDLDTLETTPEVRIQPGRQHRKQRRRPSPHARPVSDTRARRSCTVISLRCTRTARTSHQRKAPSWRPVRRKICPAPASLHVRSPPADRCRRRASGPSPPWTP